MLPGGVFTYESASGIFLPEKINIFYLVNIMLNSNFNVVFY